MTGRRRGGATAVPTQLETERGRRAHCTQPRAAPAAWPSLHGEPGPQSDSGPPRRGEAGHREGTGAQPEGGRAHRLRAPGQLPARAAFRAPRRHEAPNHHPLPRARPSEPLEELLASHPGSLRGHGSCSEGLVGQIRAGWKGRESAAAPRGQPPRSGYSQGVQSVPGAERARSGFAARGADPTWLGEPQQARRGGGQEAAPRAAAAASPATCADLEKPAPEPAAVRTPGPGPPGSPAPRDRAAAAGCARAANGVSTGEGSMGAGGARAGLPYARSWRDVLARGQGAGLCLSSLCPQYCGGTDRGPGAEAPSDPLSKS